IEQVAAAKAGIIKHRRPLVLGRVPAAAETVIRRVAERHEAPVISVRAQFGESTDAYPTTRLAGDYQRWNAATATLAARALGAAWRISDDVIARGLHAAEWPGRWQRVRIGDRELVLDASHNPEGAAVLDANLAALVKQTGRAPLVVVGALGAHRARPLLDVVCRHAREIYLVVPNQPRATSQQELRELIPEWYRGAVFPTTVKGVFPGGSVCNLGTGRDVVVVTGSIYLLGEVLTQLQLVG
ncbi:MAG TPA: bifunctional folylpolyglutamate synthase/dihydrofolate synthase, partial [Opitutus sp.]|nr:bifunctional folylpolyglutamate synthase/dihydrofolate synthase [Opitutus sp.]